MIPTKPKMNRANVGRVQARKLMLAAQVRAKPQPVAVVGPEAKKPAMPDGVCAMCRGKADPVKAREIRVKMHRAEGGSYRCIFLVCEACQRNLPAGTAEATSVVVRAVMAGKPEKW